MRSLLILIVLLVSSASFAQAPKIDLGKKIEVLVQDHPLIGGQYTADSLSITFSVEGYDLFRDDKVSQVALRLVNAETGEWLSDWSVPINLPRSQQMARGKQSFNLDVDNQAAKKALKTMKKAVILIYVADLKQHIFTGYIDLAAYCATVPNQFLNLDNGESGCPRN